MENQDFNKIAARYQNTSLVQSSAGDILLDLLSIKKHESVLDIGCGTGNITKKISTISQGSITGIDPSSGMIDEAKKHYSETIHFEINSAENMVYKDQFDVIFCNSTFQWIIDVKKALHNFHNALKIKGRVGIQACAKTDYCPNFINAIAAITAKSERLHRMYSQFVNPWLFLDSANAYTQLFVDAGFKVPFSKIQTIETFHSSEEAFNIFASGAIAGYLNQSYYKCTIDDSYINEFKDSMRKELAKQAKHNGKVGLVFNRIYLVGVKA
jgi:trans-aconitate methyltransferase